jgi:hypothetical protein
MSKIVPEITATELRELAFSVGDTPLSDAALEMHIRAARNLVDDRLTDYASEFSDQELKDIGVLVAAHFATVEDPTVEKESTANSSYSYEGNVGEGLEETRYGRRAISQDHTGALAENPGEQSTWTSVGVDGDLGPEA